VAQCKGFCTVQLLPNNREYRGFGFEMKLSPTISEPYIRLWPGVGLVSVPRIETAMHAHHAIQLSLSLEGALELRGAGSEHATACRAGWMLPDVKHAVRSSHSVVQLYLAPESSLGRRLQAMSPGVQEPLPLEAPVAEEMASRLSWVLNEYADTSRRRGTERPPLSSDLARDALFSVLECIVSHSEAPAERADPRTPKPLDPRVRVVLGLLESEEGKALKVQELARRAGLSERRLTFLFSEQVGLPLRRYVMWLRVVDGVDALSRGASLTDAALTAGFADSAHMSRAFQRLFSAPPGAFSLDYLAARTRS
jgi:AraC family transcriptional regulator